MASTLPAFGECCVQCDGSTTTAVPGPQGPAGSDGTDGANGYATLDASFTAPAVGGSDTATVVDSSMLEGVGAVWLNDAYYTCTVSNSTEVVLTLMQGTPGAVASAGMHLVPASPFSNAGTIYNPTTGTYYQLSIDGAEGSEVFSFSPV